MCCYTRTRAWNAGNRHECLVPVVNCGYGDIVSLTAAVATRAELFPCRVPTEIAIETTKAIRTLGLVVRTL